MVTMTPSSGQTTGDTMTTKTKTEVDSMSTRYPVEIDLRDAQVLVNSRPRQYMLVQAYGRPLLLAVSIDWNVINVTPIEIRGGF